jgi:nucleotide-binding universal stress UspA family protein
VEKKILLPVDPSIHSKHAIRYAVRMSAVVKDLSYTLLHVLPGISGFLAKAAECNLKAKQEVARQERKNNEEAVQILEKYRRQMMGMGVEEKRIEVVTRPKSLGLSKDVIDHAQEGLYDAIVVGRRGFTKTQRAFMGSLTADLVEHSMVIPVWVVDGEVASKKLIVAVDGSESSLRAVDHVAFMVGDNPDAFLTFFHVMRKEEDFSRVLFRDSLSEAGERVVARGNRHFVDQFHIKAAKILKEAGIGEERFEVRVARRVLNVGKAITDRARKGDYGTVVVGRRGVNDTFFIGSVSRYVLEKAANRTVWVVN